MASNFASHLQSHVNRITQALRSHFEVTTLIDGTAIVEKGC